METFELEPVRSDTDIAELKELISRHLQYTDSAVARQILANWNEAVKQFVKVMPTDYKRVLTERALKEEKAAVAV